MYMYNMYCCKCFTHSAAKNSIVEYIYIIHVCYICMLVSGSFTWFRPLYKSSTQLSLFMDKYGIRMVNLRNHRIICR